MMKFFKGRKKKDVRAQDISILCLYLWFISKKFSAAYC